MKRLTEKGFNFTSNFVASNLQSYPIAEALQKLQECEDIEERLEKYEPKDDFTDCLRKFLLAYGPATTLEVLDTILTDTVCREVETLDDLVDEMDEDISNWEE